MDEELVKAIENKDVLVNQDSKELGRILKDKYNWDPDEARKIWCFGPEETGPNVFVDKTVGV